MKNLRKIIGIALDNSWIDKNPFAKVKISYKEKNPVFLTDIELKKLLDRKFDIVRLEKVRDFFVFVALQDWLTVILEISNTNISLVMKREINGLTRRG